MKKNLRFASAAAAALLTVAPVAASSVSTVLADTIVPTTVINGKASNPAASENKVALKLDVTNQGSIKAGSEPSSLAVTLSSNFGTPKAAKVEVFEKGSKTAANKLEAGKTYTVKATNVTLSGLTAGAKYIIDGKAYDADAYGNITTSLTVNEPTFTVPNTSLTGNPYFTNAKDQTISSSSADFSGSIDGLVKNVEASAKARIDGSATVSFSGVESSVRAGLAAAGVTVKADGTFDAPATSFNVVLNELASNGKTASLPVLVKVAASHKVATDVPAFNYRGAAVVNGVATLTDADNYLALNSNVNAAAFKGQFTATVTAKNSDSIPVSFDLSKVNTAVAGVYPVTASATNPNGKTSKITFNVTVGDKDASYKTVSGDDAPVYTIDGNSVAKTSDVAKNGTQVATYGSVEINGKSYTRINGASSNKFVETEFVNGSHKAVAGVEKTVMHNAYVYNKEGKRVGSDKKTYGSTIKVYGDKVKLANGVEAYKISSSKDEYVVADNIDGTTRELSHNAYIYKTSHRRANRKTLKAGTTITTYGGSYKFKNGKAYYRIADKQWVKVANFK